LNNISKATQLELKVAELKNELNLIIDSILLTRDCKPLEALTLYLEQSIEDLAPDAGLARCSLCFELTSHTRLTLSSHHEDLCASCQQADLMAADVAYPSQSIFGVR
jgi:hypothetical protein